MITFFDVRSNSLPTITTVSNVPILNQSDYSFLDSLGVTGPGGCVPTSFAMMFIGHINAFKPEGVTLEFTSQDEKTSQLIDEMGHYLNAYVGENEWWDFLDFTQESTLVTTENIIEKMEFFQTSFVLNETDSLHISWDIDFIHGTIINNSELVEFIKQKLSANESVLFLATLPSGRGHASVITGYQRRGNNQYFRIHDTWSTSDAPWYKIIIDDSASVDPNTGIISFAPLKLEKDGEEWKLSHHIANPREMIFTIVPLL